MNAWFAIGSSGFGVVSVTGRSRVPSPPTRTTAFIGSPGARHGAAVVGAAVLGAVDGGAVVRGAAVLAGPVVAVTPGVLVAPGAVVAPGTVVAPGIVTPGVVVAEPGKSLGFASAEACGGVPIFWPFGRNAIATTSLCCGW